MTQSIKAAREAMEWLQMLQTKSLNAEDVSPLNPHYLTIHNIISTLESVDAGKLGSDLSWFEVVGLTWVPKGMHPNVLELYKAARTLHGIVKGEV